MKLGFIGTGKITSSVVTGICRSNLSFDKIILSSRSRTVAQKLKKKFRKISKNFWAISGMMAPFYELLSTMSIWLVKRGIKKDKAQKYITSLFVALSEDAVVNSKKDLKNLVKESQTPRGLNEQGGKELRKSGFYRSTEKTLNSILKRLNKV